MRAQLLILTLLAILVSSGCTGDSILAVPSQDVKQIKIVPPPAKSIPIKVGKKESNDADKSAILDQNRTEKQIKIVPPPLKSILKKVDKKESNADVRLTTKKVDIYAPISKKVYSVPKFLKPTFILFRNQSITFSDVTKLKVQGGMSVVYSAIMTDKNLDPNGKFKVILKISDSDQLDIGSKECILVKNIPARIDIVKVYHCLYDPKSNIFTTVMEFIQGQDLFAWADRRKNSMSISTAKSVLKSMAKTLQYLHSINISHRDIKLENILLRFNTDSKIPPTPVYIDFGFASRNESGTDFCGTPGIYEINIGCFGPEYLELSSGKNDPINYKDADVFSLGVLFYQFLSWDPMDINDFSGSTMMDQIVKYFRVLQTKAEGNKNFIVDIIGTSNEDCKSAAAMITGMVKSEPKMRLTIDQVVHHPFFDF